MQKMKGIFRHMLVTLWYLLPKLWQGLTLRFILGSGTTRSVTAMPNPVRYLDPCRSDSHASANGGEHEFCH